MEGNILVTGSVGQIGSELVPALRAKYGKEKVIAAGNRTSPPISFQEGPFITLDVTDSKAVENIVQKYKISTIYHLASLLSAISEQKPDEAWEINVNGLKNILDAARKYQIKVFWPSSIGAFGPSTPKLNTPQHTILEPTSMYGVTKVTGEMMCAYYHKKYSVDVRGLRLPGIISSETLPGGGTTDYAVGIFYGAISEGKYTCYLRDNTFLPMMYMPDSIQAILNLMESPNAKRGICYNITAFSFTPKDLAAQISNLLEGFEIRYEVDPVRQEIADSWPDSIDHSEACADWNWNPQFGLKEMVVDMLEKLTPRLESS